MSKVEWKPGTMVYPVPAVMVSLGDMDNSNIITCAWTGTICSDPAMTYISIRKERYSYDIINKTKEFVINLTTKDLVRATDWCGVRSGKDYDKFKECNLTKEKCNHVNCPQIKESPISIECRVVETKDLGSHTMIMAEVLCVSADEKYFDENDKFCLEKANLVAYSHGQYYLLGENLGKFGFSVKKEK